MLKNEIKLFCSAFFTYWDQKRNMRAGFFEQTPVWRYLGLLTLRPQISGVNGLIEKQLFFETCKHENPCNRFYLRPKTEDLRKIILSKVNIENYCTSSLFDWSTPKTILTLLWYYYCLKSKIKRAILHRNFETIQSIEPFFSEKDSITFIEAKFLCRHTSKGIVEKLV